jgi:hypothetical protein
MPKNARKPTHDPRKRRTPVDILTTDTTPIAQAFDHAWASWAATHILDDLDTTPFEDRRDAVLHASSNLSVHDVGALMRNSTRVIAAAAEVNSLQKFARPQQRHLAHRTRNIISALLWTTAQKRGLNPCTIIEEMPKMPVRIAGTGPRPAQDDEILLLRLRALNRLSRAPKFIGAGVMYALAESGAWPVETTRATLHDFDDPAAPTTFRVRADAARTDTRERLLALPRWAQDPLGPALARQKSNDPRQQRCVYLGDQSNKFNSASVTSTQTMIRAIEDVGIDAGLMPQEVVYWRAGQLARTAGRQEAVRIVGFTDENATTNLRAALLQRGLTDSAPAKAKVRTYVGL